jgi:two-component system, chemotaxis family, protein-glutamate methylesterase/glutaminase
MIPIRIALVDDSPFIRKAFQAVLETEPKIELVGLAAKGEDLLDNLSKWKPDLILLDLSLPGIGGLGTLDRLLERRRIPVIVLSTASSHDASLTIEALHRGAVEIIDKHQHTLLSFLDLRSLLLEKILGVTHRNVEAVFGALTAKAAARDAPPPSTVLPGPPPPAVAPPEPPRPEPCGPRRVEALLIGASTGGPPAIQELLEGLGGELHVPAAVVQHMPAGFTKAFAQRLDAHLPFGVTEAVHGAPFEPGMVYIAQSGYHLALKQEGEAVRIATTLKPDGLSHRPSADVLFQSAVRIFGRRAVAVLLTGMGADGAEGLLALRKAGAHTIVQDEASCIVYGMPKAAADLGAAREQLPLSQIGPRVADLLRR